jgi:hypothetical protein
MDKEPEVSNSSPKQHIVDFVINLLFYSFFVCVYCIIAIIYLSAPLYDLSSKSPILYSFFSLLLIVFQGIFFINIAGRITKLFHKSDE